MSDIGNLTALVVAAAATEECCGVCRLLLRISHTLQTTERVYHVFVSHTFLNALFIYASCEASSSYPDSDQDWSLCRIGVG